MTSAPSTAARRLRIVDEAAAGRPPGERTPVVGYVVLVPEGTDPTELFTADGSRVRFRPLLPADRAPGPGAAAPPAPRQPSAQQPAPTAADGLHVDPLRHVAQVGGRRLALTYLEFGLLAHLVAHPHRVHSRSHLVATLWGYSHVGGRTVDVHIARLRRKLGRFRETIVTVRRVGYKYEPGRAG